MNGTNRNGLQNTVFSTRKRNTFKRYCINKNVLCWHFNVWTKKLQFSLTGVWVDASLKVKTTILPPKYNLNFKIKDLMPRVVMLNFRLGSNFKIKIYKEKKSKHEKRQSMALLIYLFNAISYWYLFCKSSSVILIKMIVYQFIETIYFKIWEQNIILLQKRGSA